MLASWQIFLSGALLGVSIAAPPGPVNAAATYQVTKSWIACWLTLLGATTADGIFFVLTYFGLTSLVASGQTRELLFAAGGGFMFYLAYTTLRSATRRPKIERARSGKFPFLLGLTIGITNPFQFAWWISVGVGMISNFGTSIVLGFFTGILAWTLFLSSILHQGFSRYRGISPILAYASGVILLGFGAWFLYSAISSLV